MMMLNFFIKNNKKIIISLIIILALAFSFYVSAAKIIFFGGESAEEVIVFSTVGTHSWRPPSGVDSIEVLVVAGGGGGSENQYDDGAGGGAGGVVYNSNFLVTDQDYSVVVGSGGAVYANGQNSSFGSLVAIGGGRGGGHRGGASGANGGSGGGSGGQYSGTDNNQNGLGVSGQGNSGGKSVSYGGGGGGGAGKSGEGASVWQVGGNGGDGLPFYIDNGLLKYYGGGGGGFPNGLGGIGGGGSAGVAGQVNTGGGGGGGKTTGLRAQPGGSGVVIIKFSRSKVKTGSLQDGLIAHWTMDQKDYNTSNSGLTDKTPHGNNAVNNGAIPTFNRHDEYGRAMKFNGSNNYMIMNDVVTNNPTSFTISAWIRKDGDGGTYECALHQGTNYAVGNSSFWLGLSSNDNFVATIGAVTGAGWSAGQLTEKPVIGEWNHLLATWNGNIVRVYLNGIFKKQYNLNSYSNLTTPVRIGASDNGNNYQFNGSVDDVRIYNRFLLEDEVALIYNSYSPKIIISSLQKGLVLDMPLKLDYTKTSTPGSQIMTDRTTYSNNGQNYGAIINQNSAAFNGTSNYIGNIDTLNTSIFEPSSITVSSWINMDTDASTVRHIWFTKWLGYSFEIEANTRIPYFRLNGPGDIRSNTPITLGKWHHVVGTYDPLVGGRIYLDGNLVGSRAANGQITHSRSHPLNIGRYHGGIYFKGKISNARIYNRAISSNEVEMLYDRGY